ncbi:zinc-ribbon domain-containing protein [Methanoregula sp.]|uniref:zinc ribbon domain-containing protein n=1 Tax=Methanoregula sp. TaxID=2052170 RepID=UPI003568D679
MTNNPPSLQGPSHCPNCHGPLPPGARFCETCGAKIELLPVCWNCEKPVPSGAKFCENCGAPRNVPVSRHPAPVPPLPETVVAAHAPVQPAPKAPGEKTPLPKNTLVLAGVIGAVILIAVVIFVVLPMLSGSAGTSTSSGFSSVKPAATTASSAGKTTKTTTVSGTSSSTVPGPTQTLPAAYDLSFQVDKDAISGDVTVTVTGPSRDLVNDIEVTLRRADGQVITKDIIPGQKMTEVTLAGTRNSERVEVTVQFYSGDQYKVIDTIAEFNRRT